MLTPPDTWSCPIWDLQMFFWWDHWHSVIHFNTDSKLFTSFDFLSNLTLFMTPPFHVPFPGLTLTEFDMTEYRFPWGICNGCDMLKGDAYSSRHLVLSHFRTCNGSKVETNLSWTCLVSGLLSFEHPTVLLFLPEPSHRTSNQLRKFGRQNIFKDRKNATTAENMIEEQDKSSDAE